MDTSYLDYYRESPDWVKVVWILSLPVFVLGMSWIIAHYSLQLRRMRWIDRTVARSPSGLLQDTTPVEQSEIGHEDRDIFKEIVGGRGP